MKRILPIVLLVLVACSSKDNKELNLDVVKKILPNGLTILLANREGAPVFSAYVRVKVGNIEESEGSSGLAHFFEHMAFKGTSKIGTKDFSKEKPLLDSLHRLGTELTVARKKGAPASEISRLEESLKKLQAENDQFIQQNEFVQIMQRNGGGDLNATTSNDFTSYFVSLPSNKLKLWAYMETQRISDPVLREFYKERDVVFEERLMRYEINPEGKLYEAFMETSFDESPYRINVIGYAEDIKNYTFEAAKKFRDDFYIPSRMVVTVVGHFPDVDDAMQILETYFGALPSKEDTPKIFKTETLKGFPRRKVIESVSEPRFYLGYHRPGYPHPDDIIFDALEQILCEGRTGRLFKTIVDEKKLASSIDCYASLPANRLDGLFAFYAVPLAPYTNEDVYKAILIEIKKIQNGGVTSEELTRMMHQMDADMIYSLESNMGLAGMLSFFESLTGDWHYLYSMRDRMRRITSDEVKKVAQEYFMPERESLVLMEKKKGAL